MPSTSLRNQLFIALTASKAWVRLSGVSKYLMCKEIRQFINNDDTFTFTYKKPLG